MRQGQWWRMALAGLLYFAAPAGAQQGLPRHPLTIDDVLDVQRIDSATLSPDGNWVAAVVQRPARKGEVYGRMAYEVDPSRSDVWLIDTRSGTRRLLTDGKASGAGYWCATWSPDGQRLALLSTQSEHREPRGGDNVRLYVWDRASGAVTRMGDTAVMNHTRYGGGLYKLDLRGGAVRKHAAHACNPDDENAPFLWLDNRRLLVATLPPGQVSGLIDQYGRPFSNASRTAERLRGGTEPTLIEVGSGAARLPRDEAVNRAILRIVDVSTRRAATIADVPIYPFRSTLSLSVSPDGKLLAVLATLGALQPRADRMLPNPWDEDWTVERRLGFVGLAPGSAVNWLEPPAAARYPLTLSDWSPDSSRIAFTARGDPYAATAASFAAYPDGRSIPAPKSESPPPVPEPGFALPHDSTLLEQTHRDAVLWCQNARTGVVLHLTRPSDKTTRDLLTLDRHLADVDWGETRLIDYTASDGQPLKAAVILPPGYRAGQRYPTLVWVYGGYRVRGLEGDYFTDPFMPGIYNLYLYAARGYVVMVPSIPLGDRAERGDVYAQIPNGVMPAVDRLVALGIADPERLGVFGQSFGGYSVYALVTQTGRFKAAVAIAGITDLTSLYGEFDPGSTGYSGIAHEKSDNWAEMDFWGRRAPPWRDAAGYASVSPLDHVDRVTTPLLMIHGELDMRGAPSQSERFFYALYAQGKTAKLLRYGGESHSLAQSPANIRSIFAETVAWFDAYLLR